METKTKVILLISLLISGCTTPTWNLFVGSKYPTCNGEILFTEDGKEFWEKPDPKVYKNVSYEDYKMQQNCIAYEAFKQWEKGDWAKASEFDFNDIGQWQSTKTRSTSTYTETRHIEYDKGERTGKEWVERTTQR